MIFEMVVFVVACCVAIAAFWFWLAHVGECLERIAEALEAVVPKDTCVQCKGRGVTVRGAVCGRCGGTGRKGVR